jgi:hypothetical protein
MIHCSKWLRDAKFTIAVRPEIATIVPITILTIVVLPATQRSTARGAKM